MVTLFNSTASISHASLPNTLHSVSLLWRRLQGLEGDIFRGARSSGRLLYFVVCTGVMAFADEEMDQFFGSGSTNYQCLGHSAREATSGTSADSHQGGQGWHSQANQGRGDKCPVVPTLASACHQVGRGDSNKKAEHGHCDVAEVGGGLSTATLAQHSFGVQEAAEGQSEV